MDRQLCGLLELLLLLGVDGLAVQVLVFLVRAMTRGSR